MKEKPSNTPAETRHRSQLVKSWDTRLAHHECESCLSPCGGTATTVQGAPHLSHYDSWDRLLPP